jgi:hypothetical protein
MAGEGFNDEIGPLIGALARARGEFPEIPRTRTAVVRMKSGGQYSYTYADLADVLNAVVPALSAYELAVRQYPESGDIVTEVWHSSGACLKSRWPIKAMPQRSLEDAQSYQSAVQVAKRYALTAALNISTEETVEGDPKAQRFARETKEAPNPLNMDEHFETPDGIRSPKGARFTKEMTPRQKAEEAARAIEAQFDEVKTVVGLNGVWNRNQAFIDALSDGHGDLFQSVYDKFHSLCEQLEPTE